MQDLVRIPIIVALTTVFAGCGGGNDSSTPAALPQLSAAASGSLLSCTDLATKTTFANTTFASSVDVPAGQLVVATQPIAQHCLVRGSMYQRVSPVDAQSYAIGFEMRLPNAWNGRFFYQANGGSDGQVAIAGGAISGGGRITSALAMGFAVISSDAGHTNAQNPLFGIDPQARLDYGYQAVQKLTPMAKALISTAYGRGPDRSYIGGTSNGGRHALVAAARLGDQYDGFIAQAPGFNLPKAAIAELWGAQQFAKVATVATDLSTGFNTTERAMVAGKILAKCDALDGAADGLVQDVDACQKNFDLISDVPTCTGSRDGTCLTTSQKSAVIAVFSGPRNSRGDQLYSNWAYDTGVLSTDWAQWKFVNSVGNRGPVSMAFTFQTPPASPSVASDTLGYALNFNMDIDAPRIFATDATYTESAMSFMTPPHPTDLSTLKNRGAKLIIVHGVSDPVFSVNDTTAFYENLRSANDGDATNFARYFRVPGMTHSGNGPSTDQFDLITLAVKWVEEGQAPDRILATARGPGNAIVNPEVPASWSPNRTRPLCPYPKVARYLGTGSVEVADSFACQ